MNTILIRFQGQRLALRLKPPLALSRAARRAVAIGSVALAAAIAAPSLSVAEDSIERKGGKSFHGEVTEVSRTEVVLKGRSNQREYRIPADEIERIQWDGEKADVLQLRIEERNGRFDKAIAAYESAVKDAALASNNLRTELDFLLARATSSKAFAEQDHYDDAIGRLEKFRTEHPTSFHYFESLRLLARLYMAKDDLGKLSGILKQMAEAPWSDYKMETDILQARVSLSHDDVATALASLENVIRVKPSSPSEVSRRYEALLAKAACLEKQAKFQEAVDVLSSIFDEADEKDVRTLAETCVRLGECYQAAGRTKEAILAYLRVDILFPKDKGHHAEALYHLSRLFLQDGKPDKAADAAARLQETFPKSEWTKKLSLDRPAK